MRRDALFEICDALACRQERAGARGAVPEAGVPPGHSGVYDALNSGEVHVAWLRRALFALPPLEWADGRADRLAAEASPERLFCHAYARGRETCS